MNAYLWRFHSSEYMIHSNEYAVVQRVILSAMKRVMQNEDPLGGTGLSSHTIQISAAALTSPPPPHTRTLATCLASWPGALLTVPTVLEPGLPAGPATTSAQEALHMAPTDKTTPASMPMHQSD